MTDVPEKPSPTTAALRKGLSRCRAAYPGGPWPAQTDAAGWRALVERWESGCYGMTDEVFLQAVEDHLAGPYRQYTASPGHLWVAVDLRREAEGRSAGEGPLPVPKQEERIAGYMEEIRKQIGQSKEAP